VTLPDSDEACILSPPCEAAIFIFASQLLRQRQRPELPPTATAIIELLGCSRSQAYAMRERLEALCCNLAEPPGRPPAEAAPSAVEAMLVAVRDFAFTHPGAVSGCGDRRRYSEAFRRFIVGRVAAGEVAHALSVEQTATAAGVPLGTLKDWLAVSHAEADPADPLSTEALGLPGSIESEPSSSFAERYTSSPSIAVILHEYQHWEGDFTTFCDHLETDHRLPYGRTFIASVLEAAGLREPTPRRGKRVPWSRGTYRRLFPGAQWLGDGTSLAIELNGQRFAFNLEAISDVDSGAILGTVATDSEDEVALLQSFDLAVLTTGAPPLAITLDNRPSNHTDTAVLAMQPATVLRATRARGQAKAGLEGAFGLFAQTAPPLVVTGDTPRERARSTLSLLVTLWAWARNGRPQRRLGHRSPREHYLGPRPSPQQQDAARVWLAELERRSALAREKRTRQVDPVRRELLRTELDRLGIADPEQKLASAIARYSSDAILQGLAIFDSKQRRDTLPQGADSGRYLAGIIRNVDSRLELLSVADYLLELRLRDKELTLTPLKREHQALVKSVSQDTLPQTLLDRALQAEPLLDFRYWAKAACHALAAACAQKSIDFARERVRQLARAIAATFSVTMERRHQLVADLTRASIELA